jgi:glutathione S-transferase
MSDTPEYQLYCFAQSGNAYRVALMLNLIGADWKPVFVDFFVGGETRTEKYRTEINEMGEVPVLAHGARKLSQSAVCLTYLAGRSGKFRPEGDDEQLECLRWIVFDNQKVNGFLGPYRFLKNFAPAPNPGGEAFLLGRIGGNLAIVWSKRRIFSARGRPSPTYRWPDMSTIPRTSSVSTSPRTIRRSVPGWSASRRCRAGSTPMT